MHHFFAVTLKDEVVAHVTAHVAKMRALVEDVPIAWVPPEKLHYTLRFLGTVAPERVARIAEAARAVAQQTDPFPLMAEGVGAFPSARSPRVLWIGASSGVEPLVDLADRLDHALTPLGFGVADHPFRPHLTIARSKGKPGERALRKILEGEPRADVGVMSIDAFGLMTSGTEERGYGTVEVFPLGKR